MVLSVREKDILQKVVFGYINRAEPISSGWLETMHNMPCSPATIRSEMLSLTEEGYLQQPHTSAGRIPTDKGYRFFVDELLAEDPFELSEAGLNKDVYEIGKNLAAESSSLVCIYVPKKKFVWKEGWEQVLQEPEFEERKQIGSFTRFLKDVEQWIQKIRSKKVLGIYIGGENPFSQEQNFSILIAVHKEQTMALVGPKRMEYQKNIELLNSLWKRKI
jgi:transcriptional regulator of heat shock response